MTDQEYDEVWNLAIEHAAQSCETQSVLFLDPAYATGQPLSSFQERFACEQCAMAVRACAR